MAHGFQLTLEDGFLISHRYLMISVVNSSYNLEVSFCIARLGNLANLLRLADVAHRDLHTVVISLCECCMLFTNRVGEMKSFRSSSSGWVHSGRPVGKLFKNLITLRRSKRENIPTDAFGVSHGDAKSMSVLGSGIQV